MIYIANARMPTEKAHGIQLAKMCEAFIEEGVSLTLAVPRRGGSDDPIEGFYELRVSVPVVKLPALDTYEKGRFGFFAGSFVFMVSYFLYCLWQKMRGRIDWIYTTDIDQFSFLFIPLIGLPYVAELHDAKPRSRRYAWFLRRARGIVAVNSLVKRDLREVFGVSETRIIVQPNGIDMAHFGKTISKKDARARLGLPENLKIALYVGKFYSWKGLSILIRTAERLREGVLYAVGGTKEELVSAAGVRAIPPSLICVNQRQHREIPLWLCAADALLVLGTRANEYSWLHTSPMKLFEYLPSRRPIVASRTPAIEDVVSERDVIFYEPDNPESLAKAIERAWSAGEDVLQRTESALRRAQEFTWEKRAQTILSFVHASEAFL